MERKESSGGWSQEQGSEPRSHVDSRDVVLRVPQVLRVLEHLVGGSRDGQRVLVRFTQLQRQSQVLLHVTQRHFPASGERRRRRG